jgi:hypothetical protein
MNLPRYFIVGNRPVKFVGTEDGGMAVKVFDWSNGSFVDNLDYLLKAIYSDETQEVTEEQFLSHVDSLRKSIS